MKALMVLAWVVVGAMPVLAGNIFGTVFEKSQAAKGVTVTVKCGTNSYQAQTDADGSYSVRAEETGRCSLAVNYKEQTPEAEIFSYDQPTRYDFDLVDSGGKYALKKK